MKVLVDTHTHTIASGHAFSTLIENAKYANINGLQAFVSADHGTSMECTGPDFAAMMYKYLPDEMEGVRVFMGFEANIIDFKGTLDVVDTYAKLCDFMVASMHKITLEPGNKEENTCTVLKALENPYVDLAGHMDRHSYQLEREAIVKKANELNKLIEINNHSFKMGAGENTVDLIRLCKKYDQRICVSSDAHIAYSVGDFALAIKALEEENFPEELIVNRNLDSFNKYLEEKKRR